MMPEESRADLFADQTKTQPMVKRLLPAGIAVLALVGFASLIWYAYSWGKGTVDLDGLPVIKTETGPEKVRPEREGGLEVPHQDKALLNSQGQATADSVEHLLPPPEAPLPPEQMLADEIGDLLRAQSEPDFPSFVPEAKADDAALPLQNVTELPALAVPPLTTEAGATEAGAAEADAAPAKEKTPAAVQVATHVSEGDLYVLQLASVTSQAAAEKGWAELQQTHPALLRDLSLDIEQAEVNGTLYFRIRTGPFPNITTAKDMCAQLKAQNQDCLVKGK